MPRLNKKTWREAFVQSDLYIAGVGMTQFGRHLDKQVW